MAHYAETLRAPHVARLIVSGALGRLPAAMEVVAVVLFVREATGSYGIAGAVAAAHTIGFGGSGPVYGRLIDRHGIVRVLCPLAAVHVAALGSLVIIGSAAPTEAAMLGCGLMIGGSLPPTGPLVRRLLSEATSDRRAMLPAVYALDAISTEVAFIGGPFLVAVIISVSSSGASLVACCVVCVLAVYALLTIPMSRQQTSTASSASSLAPRDRLGPLRSPAIRVLLSCLVPVGVAYGALQVSMIAFAGDVHASWSAPWLLALLSLGGAAGALGYGARGHLVRAPTALAVSSCVLPPCLAALLFAPSLAVMALLLVVAGAVLTPMMSVANQLVGDAAPPGAATEAFSWTFMGAFMGASIGLIIAGALIDAGGWRLGTMLGIFAAVLSALSAVLGRRVLPNHPPEERVIA